MSVVEPPAIVALSLEEAFTGLRQMAVPRAGIIKRSFIL